MNTLFVFLLIFFVALLIVSVVAYWKEKTLDEIRVDAYELFKRAEHMYAESGHGKQKMKWVISQARKLLPSWLQVILTEEMFEKLLQLWFDEIEDLLDDGKLNGSEEK